MNVTEVIAHIRACADQYESDADALRQGPKDHTGLATRFEGKADGLRVAAALLDTHQLGKDER